MQVTDLHVSTYTNNNYNNIKFDMAYNNKLNTKILLPSIDGEEPSTNFYFKLLFEHRVVFKWDAITFFRVLLEC